MKKAADHPLILFTMLLVWCLSAYLGGYFVLSTLLYLLHPSAAFPFTLILSVGGPGPHATNLLLATGTGVVLNLLARKQRLQNILALPAKELAVIIPSSYWLSAHYASQIPLINLAGVIGRLAVFVLFLFFLPLAVEYFTSQSIKGLIGQIQHLRVTMPKRLLFVPAGVIALILLYNLLAIRENNLRGYFLIRKVYPKYAIYATTIKLTGYNFGWKQDGKPRYKLNSNYGEIGTKEWNSGYVIFEVPLHLKPGKITVWLEKPTTEEAIATVESNKVSFTLVDRNILYPDQSANRIERALKKIQRFFVFEVGLPFKIVEPGKDTTN